MHDFCWCSPIQRDINLLPRNLLELNLEKTFDDIESDRFFVNAFRMKSFVGIICLLICASNTYASKSHPITTLLNAKWQTTPVYLEISEFLFDESPNFYWDYVRELVNLPISQHESGKTVVKICIFVVLCGRPVKLLRRK